MNYGSAQRMDDATLLLESYPERNRAGGLQPSSLASRANFIAVSK
jgi:hypothetical protein